MNIFADSRVLDSVQFEAMLGPVRDLYGASFAGLPATNHVTIQVQSDDSAPVWARCFPATHPLFVRAAARVSVAIQSALRAWLPYLWFGDLERFDDFETSASLLIYSACRPYTPKNRQAFTFDVLDGDTRRAILYSVKRTLGARLAQVESMLLKLRPKVAPLYRPLHIDRVMGAYERKPHAVNAILVAERELVEEYVLRADRWMTHKTREQSDTVLARRYRKLYMNQDWSFLRPIVETEAAHALAEFTGTEYSRSATFLANSGAIDALSDHESHSHHRGGDPDLRPRATSI